MVRLIFWVLLLVALFSGYWFAAAQATQTGVQNAFADARNDGWQIETADLSVTGFPGTFDLQIAGPAVVAPDGQFAWNGPALQVAAPSISPTRLSLTLPESQTLRLADQTLQIETTQMLVAVATRLNRVFDFDVASIAVEDANVRSDLGWQVQLRSGDATLTAVEGEVAAYDLDVAVADLALPDSLVGQFAPEGALSYSLASLTADAKLTLDRAIDRFAFEADPPALTRIDLTGFDLNWGDVAINATGALDVDASGVPEGQITLKSAQWQAMIDILVAAGALDAGIAPTLSNVARTMADDEGVLELPITFRGGFMSMGLLPLGPAPRLR